MAETGEYILGTDRAELDRLRFQHHAWVQQGHALWRRAGFREGETLLDLGCGPGFTSMELAHVVGPTGRIIAHDQSPGFLEFLRRECAHAGLHQVDPSLGSAQSLELPAGSLDGAYSRWLLCWVPDPGAVAARVAAALRPGGALVLQEYLDWAAMKLMPRSASFERAVDACMASWRAGHATIDLCDHLPELAARAGLTIEHFAPIARVGGVGSLEWRWLGSFFQTYLPRLVDRGIYAQDDLRAFLAEWQERADAGVSYVATPTMADAVLRKPR